MLPFRDHLEQSLSRPVEFIPFREARGLVVAMEQQTIAYAIAPGSVLAATHTLCSCVEPLAMQPNGDGSKGLFAVVIAAADGPVGNIEDIRADRLVVIGEGSVIAHQIGLSDLWSQDVRIDIDQITQYTSSLPDAVALLQTGTADAILSWTRQADGSVLFAAPPAHQLEDDVRSGLRILWRSRPVPGLSHYAHRDLDAALIDQLRELITGLASTNGEAFDAIDQGSGRPFVETSIPDYAPYMDAMAYWSR
jgi:phosphonate transport system substrate-binding protein